MVTSGHHSDRPAPMPCSSRPSQLPAQPVALAQLRFGYRRFSKHPPLRAIRQYLPYGGIPVRGDIATACDAASTQGGLPGGEPRRSWLAPERR